MCHPGNRLVMSHTVSRAYNIQIEDLGPQWLQHMAQGKRVRVILIGWAAYFLFFQNLSSCPFVTPPLALEGLPTTELTQP